MDGNNSGNIREKEFNAFTNRTGLDFDFSDESRSSNLVESMSYKDAAKHQKDKDPAINEEELAEYLRSIGAYLTSDQLSALFRKMARVSQFNSKFAA
jgi:Ca2+-binding EF-hand superfamily protein